jgi:hypothetical protein
MELPPLGKRDIADENTASVQELGIRIAGYLHVV